MTRNGPFPRTAAAALLLPALMLGCSGPAIGNAPAADTATPPANKGPMMTASTPCAADNIARTSCMIRLILDDIAAHYDQTGGGGISAIRQLSTTRFQAELPQEERADLLTYDFDIADDGAISITGRTASTESKGPR